MACLLRTLCPNLTAEHLDRGGAGQLGEPHLVLKRASDCMCPQEWAGISHRQTYRKVQGKIMLSITSQSHHVTCLTLREQLQTEGELFRGTTNQQAHIQGLK